MSTLPRQLYCVLVPLEGDTLLVPNALVAETTGTEALTVIGDGSGWPAGEVEWNRQVIPAVRFAAASGVGALQLARRTRLVVLHALTGVSSQPIALVADGHPHLVTLGPEAVQAAPLLPGDAPGLVLARVSIGSNQAFIPDLEGLQQRLADRR
jgi:chemosensory pili system protein ChpC